MEISYELAPPSPPAPNRPARAAEMEGDTLEVNDTLPMDEESLQQGFQESQEPPLGATSDKAPHAANSNMDDADTNVDEDTAQQTTEEALQLSDLEEPNVEDYEEEAEQLENEPVEAYQAALPLARIKRICKADPDVTNISAEATHLLAFATQLFIDYTTQLAANRTLRVQRKTLALQDLFACFDQNECYEFLEDIPLVPTDTAEAALEKRERENQRLTAGARRTRRAPTGRTDAPRGARQTNLMNFTHRRSSPPAASTDKTSHTPTDTLSTHATNATDRLPDQPETLPAQPETVVADIEEASGSMTGGNERDPSTSHEPATSDDPGTNPQEDAEMNTTPVAGEMETDLDAAGEDDGDDDDDLAQAMFAEALES
ncbi:uncharacterized protein MONBRDRAFT_25749 [Monosiga brevicollis MX1]|uniref:Transcription factor CBF/NF-Y/archaeal histone domain-containing protein n=1 Tax=Monosiga brevicollis TaxID=81824 RepID=A9V0B3_MONBE|nr:uncharacterized protein MONBRDRAFT_25749 [Monosiga brevicollis MX1]EDQ89128.1 predicted protein [Monosiga brevicollis MX1]|eukprot:XP_001746233.1 hypothetical protein [Monosiga brevicollis MX1]